MSDDAEQKEVEINAGFLAALQGEDKLGVVLRTHAYVEANLDRFIELRLEAPDYFEQLSLNYSRKVDLACALGFDARYRAAFKKLGQIRNSSLMT